MRESENEFLKTRASFGLIIRADIGTIEAIKQFLATLPNVEVVYQVMDIGKLWIVKDSDKTRREGSQ